MAFKPAPDCVKAVIGYHMGTMYWTNSLWFRRAAFTNTDMTELADAIDAKVNTDLCPKMSDQCTYDGVKVYDMRTIDGLVVLNDDNASAGDNTGDPEPIDTALVLTLRTLYRGRSARGRLYFTGFLKNDLDDGLWKETLVTAVEGFYGAVHADALQLGWAPVIVSFQEDKVKLEEGFSRIITAWEVRSRIPGNQRRRLDRP
jgi:hypothetical protein